MIAVMAGVAADPVDDLHDRARNDRRCLVGAWAVGGSDRFLAQRILLPGDRRSFGWDAYGAGPEGCHAELRLDAERGLLLTETISSYSYGFGHDHRFHWREWDLRTGQLRVAHPERTFAGREIVERPPGFAVFREPEPRRTELTPAEVAALRAHGLSRDQVGIVAATSDGRRALCAEHGRGRRPWRRAARLWLCDADRGVAFATAVRWDPFQFEVRAIFVLDGELCAWAVDRDQNVHRIVLAPGDDSGEPVRAFAVGADGERIACLRGAELDVRSARGGEPLATRDLVAAAGEHPDVPVLVDGQWAVTESAWRDAVAAVPPNGRFAHRGELCSATDPVWRCRLALEPGEFPSGTNALLSVSGALALRRDRTSIAVHDTASGQRFARLQASHNLYGGGHSLRGLAVSVDDRFVISSDDGGAIAVWDLHDRSRNLERAEPHWWILGLERVGRIRELAFFHGSWRIAIATDDDRVCAATFWSQSEVLADLRLPQAIERIAGQPFGDRVFVLLQSGRVEALRYVPGPNACATTCAGNTLRVRYRDASARSVAVAGSFNGWNAGSDPLARGADGVFERAFVLPDGHHEYKLVVDESDWRVDPNVPFRPGPFGPNSHVVLPDDPWRGTVEW
jgi:hypothetical protein